MPLIIITGYPCAGKTHRASQIASDFTTRIDEYNDSNRSARPLSVQHIQSRHSSLPSETTREEIYTSANAEKTARAAEFSAIKRALNKDTVVIADSGNYIKGYRYQLWCEAKAVGTRCCVVHVASREDEVDKWNTARAEQAQQDVNSIVVEEVKGAFVDKPESHTFIYGDRSLDAAADEDGLPESLKAKRKQDRGYGTMESDLKSLYINPNVPERDTSSEDTTTAQDVNVSPQHTIHSATNSTQAPEQPDSRPQQVPPAFPPTSPPYTASTLHSLISRYEPPSPFTRWDTPLFTIPSVDAHPPYSEIWGALFPHLAAPSSVQQILPLDNSISTPSSAPSVTTTATRNPNRRQVKGETRLGTVKQHAATIQSTHTSSEALQILERGTQSVVKRLLEFSKERQQQQQSQHSTSTADESEEEDIEIEIPLPPPLQSSNSTSDPPAITLTIPPQINLNLPTLQRLRRRYVQIQRTVTSRSGGVGNAGTTAAMVAGKGDERNIVAGFVRWIEEEIQDGDVR
ncbi:putative rna polymerase ii elongator complex associated protein [Phaeomoniella chlamydospora]|uniref:Putative rna polymerase ii elongator complex associated protein n=1 Tax=Phaeomoniella chlamydospora TaxID=158046 RepID=A0A0G2EYG2_PHACM|nr:putative rna polymerase ii elongator complex associated protein [Phaeomoniella chlamydospora]